MTIIKKHIGRKRSLENRPWAIYLVDSGRRVSPVAGQTFADKEQFGRIFFNQARMSAAGVPKLRSSWHAPSAAHTCRQCATKTSSSREQAPSTWPGRRSSRWATGENVTSEELASRSSQPGVSGVMTIWRNTIRRV